ncbi:exodeoxyribonuclease VII large subunit [Salinisphaera sp. PC39]|uniref:exodeoxyribonuclease VII large subunit n=1 Tax=Salinisphaera sp. PC39 TaxID=1304156 RepID=UPI00333FE405
MPESPATADGTPVYSVSELNAAVRELLEHSFPLLWVEGELSNLARPRSGHWYFSLKDEAAQVRCAMFRNRNRLVDFAPRDGQLVRVRARVSLYPARGDFQLIAEHLEDAGDGALQRAFEQLKRKLAGEGLFDTTIKRGPPARPRRIGVITSPTGAAIRDVLAVLRRRYPLGEVLLHPVPVQGEAAPAAIVRALRRAGERGDCDVLLLVRGGGSLEDLWSFNDEAVARAIRACPIPVVAGVGHEVDVTIADFAADVRAPTPSAAAELVCPDQGAWLRDIDGLRRRLDASARLRLTNAGRELAQRHARLERLHPERRIQQGMQRADELEARLRRAVHWSLRHGRGRLDAATSRLRGASPARRLPRETAALQRLEDRLRAAHAAYRNTLDGRLRVLCRALDAVSPLRTLERGYAIAETADRRVLTDAGTARAGDDLHLRLHRGALDCRITAVHPGTGGDRDKV